MCVLQLMYWLRTNYRQIEFHARAHMNFLANFLRRQLTSLELGNKIISLYLLHIPNKLKKNPIKPLTIYIKTTGVCHMDIKSKNKEMDILKVKHYLDTWGIFHNNIFQILSIICHNGHLSISASFEWKEKLAMMTPKTMWAFAITWCPSSVVR